MASRSNHNDVGTTVKARKARKINTTRSTARYSTDDQASVAEDEDIVFADDDCSTEPEDSDVSSGDEQEADAGRDAQRQNTKMHRDSPELLARTITVSNLPTNVKKKEVNRLFRDCGPVESIRFRGAVPEQTNVGKVAKRVAVIKREFADECHSLRAFIVFQQQAAAEKALKLNGTLLRDRHIFVDAAHQRASSVHYNNRDTVFIGNLPFARMDDEALYGVFSKCGPIRRVRIVRDRDSGLSRGFAYIEFAERGAVQLALQMDGVQLEGRALRVSRCRKGTKRKNQTTPAAKQGVKSRGKDKDGAKLRKRNAGQSKNAPSSKGSADRSASDVGHKEKQQRPDLQKTKRKRPAKAKKHRTKTNSSASRFYLPTSV